MKNKIIYVFKSLLWCFIILLFPIISGTISVVFSLDAINTLLLQGSFMVLSLIPPAIFILSGKHKLKEIGLGKFNIKSRKEVLYLLLPLIIFIPVAIKGFYIESAEYLLGNLFLYLFVGISEEIYFRGIIPLYLKQSFSTKGIIFISTLIFGIGHMATAFTSTNIFEILLTILNAFLFGCLAIEISILTSNIYSIILIHFIFDFETKIVAMNGNELLIAEIVRGTLMFILVIWFAIEIYKNEAQKQST